jgi:hypothetical protein
MKPSIVLTTNEHIGTLPNGPDAVCSITYGGPGRSRTADQQFRKLLLYPSELQGQSS